VKLHVLKSQYRTHYGLQLKIDINGVNLVSWKVEKPALLKAFFQAAREKK